MPPAKKINWAKAQQMRDAGATVEEIARSVGASVLSIKANTYICKKGFSKADRGTAQALIDAGWTLEAVASELGTSEQIIRLNTRPKKQREIKPLEGIFGGFA